MRKFERTRSWALTMAVIVVLTAFFIIAWVAGVLAEGAPKSGPESFAKFPDWLSRPPNPWFTVTSGLSALGAVSALAGFLGSKPASKREVEAIVVKTQTAISGQIGEIEAATVERQRELVAVFSRTSHQQALSDLQRPDVDPELVAQYDRVIRVARERGLAITPAQAADVARVANQAAQSNRPGDEEIARLIEQGQYREAAGRKAALAMARVEETQRAQAAELRDAGRLALPFAPGEAKGYFEQACELDRTDVWGWIELGRLRLAYDGIEAARRCIDAALTHVEDERDRGVLENEIGNIELASGNLGAARERFAAYLAIAERLAAQEPGNAEWQRDLSVSHNKLGDVERASGNLGAARERYAASLAIAERLAAQEPGNAQWRRDVSVSHNRLGDVERASGNLDAARERYAASLAIAERLAAQEAGNAEWQRDLSLSHNKLGDVEMASGNLGAARARYAASLAIAERLAAQEAGNAEWQRDLSVSHNKLGDVEVASGNLGAARARFAASLAIRERLAAQAPGNAGWQRDLFVSHVKLAQLAEAEGDVAAAIAAFARAEAVIAALADAWPEHPGFARDLAQVRADLARLREGEGEGEGGGGARRVRIPSRFRAMSAPCNARQTRPLACARASRGRPKLPLNG
ncbi:MAG: tetratricopeptide repeat protein [Pseudomonadota bacterium]